MQTRIPIDVNLSGVSTMKIRKKKKREDKVLEYTGSQVCRWRYRTAQSPDDGRPVTPRTFQIDGLAESLSLTNKKKASN